MKNLLTPTSRAGLVVTSVCTLLISVIALLSPGSATAGGPGTWTKISTGEVSNINRPSLGRSADGTLRALFPERMTGNAEEDLTLASVNSAGALVSSRKVLTNYSQAEDPVLLINGSTMTAVTNGLGQRFPGDPHIGRTFELTSSDGGATWVNQPYSLGKSTNAYASSGTAAILMPDNTTLAGFTQSDGLTWRNERLANPDTATPDKLIAQAGCCAYFPNFVRQGNNVWAAWYSNASDFGMFVKKILPAEGPATKIAASVDGTSSRSVGRVPMFARPDGSAYVAFCHGSTNCPVGLYRISDGATSTIPYSQADYAVDVTMAPDGTIWAVWAKDGGVYAVKSGPSDLNFSTPARIDAPSDKSVYQLSANAANGDSVDIVVNDSTAMWHSQITASMTTASPSPTTSPTVATPTPTPVVTSRPATPTPTPTQQASAPPAPIPPVPSVTPALTVKVKPSKIKAARTTTLQIRVSAAGKAVVGATVAGGGGSCTTKALGVCSIKVRPKKPGTVKLTATKAGYRPATVKVKVLAHAS